MENIQRQTGINRESWRCIAANRLMDVAQRDDDDDKYGCEDTEMCMYLVRVEIARSEL